MSIGNRLNDKFKDTPLREFNFGLLDDAYRYRRKLAGAALATVVLSYGAHYAGENIEIDSMHENQPRIGQKSSVDSED